MRGRSGCPTGQEKNSVGATGESRSDFLQGKVGYQIAPSSATVCALGHLPPKGKALGGGGTAGWNLSFTKMLSNIFSFENASQIGLGIPEGIAPRTDQRERSPKRANESERAIKPGVQGACPRPSFSPFLGRNGDPRRAGGPPGALRPEASEKPRPPAGYVVPPRPPAPPAGPHLRGPTAFQDNKNLI